MPKQEHHCKTLLMLWLRVAMVANKSAGLYQKYETKRCFYNAFQVLINHLIAFRFFDAKQRALTTTIGLNQAQRH
jgi:predicted DNA-binding helix-hairpin-helix protein